SIGWMPLPRDSKFEGDALPLMPMTGPIVTRIVDETGEDVPAGGVGHLVLSSRYIALGYWRDSGLTERHFHRGSDGSLIFVSSDLARRDPRGHMYLVGR